MTLDKLGMRVKRLRTKKRMTQAVLAEKAGVHRIYIAQIEAETKRPSLATLEKIAKALNVKMSKLLE